MMSRKLFIIFPFIGIMVLFMFACGGRNVKKQSEKEIAVVETKTFSMPDIPSALTAPEERADYLILHYWDNFNFSDLSLIDKPEITEQAFVDFISTLPHSKKYAEGITKLLDKSIQADSMMFAHFVELSDKYLYDPNSPMRNEELYILFLQYVVSSQKVDEINKINPQYRLDMAMKNRMGTIAADFTYIKQNNKKSELYDIKSDFTILFFNNPDCHDCDRVKQIMSQSEIINSLIDQKKLTVLSVFPDKEIDLWKKAVYPEKWINGRNDKLSDDGIYDLKASPTLYLLDKDKRVIFKDAPIELIEQWLYQNTTI